MQRGEGKKGKGFSIVGLVSFGVVILDQLTKFLALKYLPREGSVRIWKYLYLSLVRNKGVAFGLLKDFGYVIAPLSFVLLLLFLFLTAKLYDKKIFALGMGLVIGGAMGNLVDRIRFGYIIDFIDLRVWPVFNVADMAITAGAVIILLGTLCGGERGGGREKGICR